MILVISEPVAGSIFLKKSIVKEIITPFQSMFPVILINPKPTLYLYSGKYYLIKSLC
jgi:hypothetical protein